jgi:hypothetical protein
MIGTQRAAVECSLGREAAGAQAQTVNSENGMKKSERSWAIGISSASAEEAGRHISVPGVAQ